MAETPIVIVTREELLARREVILGKLGYTLKQWNKICKGEDWSGDDWVYRDELSDISFLLGD